MIAPLRIALVTPWYGADLFGGAERLAWDLSHALVRVGAQVDVLSTTCRSFESDWGANYHRAGMRLVEGVRLYRFKVDSRDRAAFSRANAKLVSLPRISLRRDVSPLEERDSQAFFDDNINSSALLEHLRDYGTDYDAVLFVPYLYGTTIAGVPLVAQRAFIVPCLHDEAYAYLEPVRAVFARARGLLFNSAGECEVAAAIFGPSVFGKSAIIGHAVDAVAPPRSPITIGSFAPHRSRYILYLGRQDPTKNVDFLLEAFVRFRRQRVKTSLQLILAGPRPAHVQPRDGVVVLGPVQEDVKAALLTYARALAQPSLNESFSRAVFESWYAQRPVIVHGDCRATMRAVEESGGGWIGSSIDDWVHIFGQIDDASNEAIDLLGQRGWAAAVDNGSWDAVAMRTLAAIARRQGRSAPDVAVDQLLPLGHSSANRFSAALGAALHAAGFAVATAIGETALRSDTAKVIVHATDSTRAALRGDAIVAHSGEIFVVGSPPPIFAVNVAVHQRLAERGVTARLLPQPVDPATWVRSSRRSSRFDDGRKHILSIATLDAVDAQRLIEMLVALVGSVGDVCLLVPADSCSADVRLSIERERNDLDLADSLVFVGADADEQYAALRAASVAVAFGQPLRDVQDAVNPLWFDVPVLAFDDPVVREAIEPCGIVAESRNAVELAALVKIVMRDLDVRQCILAEGRRVRDRYAPEAAVQSIVEALRLEPRLPETGSVRVANDPVGLYYRRPEDR